MPPRWEAIILLWSVGRCKVGCMGRPLPDILRIEWPATAPEPPPLTEEALDRGVVIHCFTGTPEDARAYAELGCYVSFSGIITYKTAQPIRDAVAHAGRLIDELEGLFD